MPFHHEKGKNGALLRFLDALGRHTLHPVALKTKFSIMAASCHQHACSWKAKLLLTNSLVHLKKGMGLEMNGLRSGIMPS